MNRSRRINSKWGAVALAAASLAPSAAPANVYINELFFNPGGNASDARDEFIELRGDTPGMSLANHYLIFLENELDEFAVGDAGVVENVFDLGVAAGGAPATIGSNGFLLMRQKFNRYAASQIVAGATNLVNAGANKPGSFPAAFPGFGNAAAEGSTLGARDLDGGDQQPTTGAMENSGFTAMLIRNDSGLAPVLGEDLDLGNDGLDLATGRAGWTIVDSVGTFGEGDETEFGRLYGAVNFGSGDLGFFAPGWQPKIEPGAAFELLPFEVEHIARWGNSSGQTTDDWHVTNLTDNPGSGSSGTNGNTGPVDLRQSFTGSHDALASGNPSIPPAQPTEEQGRLESNKSVPYGTPLLTNLGGPNFILGDYNRDGYVNAADFTVWRDTQGATATESTPQAADASRSFVVDPADYILWANNYGRPDAGSSTSSTAVPEPAALALFVAGALVAVARRRSAD